MVARTPLSSPPPPPPPRGGIVSHPSPWTPASSPSPSQPSTSAMTTKLPLEAVVIPPIVKPSQSAPSSSRSSSHANIQVCVRIRPLLPHELLLVPTQQPSQHPPQHRQPPPSSSSSLRRTNRPAFDLRTSSVGGSSLGFGLGGIRSGLRPPPPPPPPPLPPSLPMQPAWHVSSDDRTVCQSSHTRPNPAQTSSYSFDKAYGPLSTNDDVYCDRIREVVKSVVTDGYHGSIFAYGQTSTGKTHTMTGTERDPGVVTRAVNDCFRFIGESGGAGEREYLLRVSYLEIYNEHVYDLLAAPSAPSTSSSSTAAAAAGGGIRIFESRTEGVVVRGLKEEVVTCPGDVLALLAEGDARRRTGSTGLNRASSRSHSVFRLVVESRASSSLSSRNGGGGQTAPPTSSGSSVGSSSTATTATNTTATAGGRIGGGAVRVSSLSLVDLAGSESVKATGSTGTRQREGKYINKSLGTLGHVVHKLSELSAMREAQASGGGDGHRHQLHIPYRDSKLTRLLQPSLSGNARVCVVCTVSPLATHLDESHNTLKFASRAKRIKQAARVTEVVDDKTLLRSYREEIDALKRQLKEAREEANQARSSSRSVAKVTDEGVEMVPRLPLFALAGGGGAAASADVVGDDDDDDDEEDTMALVSAIQNLERLILKNAQPPAPPSSLDDGAETADCGKTRKTMDPCQPSSAGGEPPVARERANNMLWSGSGSQSMINGDFARELGVGDPQRTAQNDNDEMLLSPLPSSRRFFDTASMEKGDVGEPDVSTPRARGALHPIQPPAAAGNDNQEGDHNHSLIEELHRIQGLLGSVLKRKAAGGTLGSTAPATPWVLKGNGSPHHPSRMNNPTESTYQTPRRDEELVEVLRAQLHEQEVASSLRKADSSFLQGQLAQKDSLLKEVSKILDAVEKRQVELENENAKMKEDLARTKVLLAQREADLEQVSKQRHNQ